MINVEIEKTNNENSTSLLRRFTKRVQGSGVLSRVRSIRYRERKESFYRRKKKTLEYLERKATQDELVKQGKLVLGNNTKRK